MPVWSGLSRFSYISTRAAAVTFAPWSSGSCGPWRPPTSPSLSSSPPLWPQPIHPPLLPLPPAALAAAPLLSAAFDSAPWRSGALRQVMIIVAVGVASWACVFASFAAVGHLQDFLEAVVFYNRHYSGSFRK